MHAWIKSDAFVNTMMLRCGLKRLSNYITALWHT